MWPLFTTWSGGEIRISADQTGGRFPPSARRFFSGGRPVDFAPVVGHVIQIAAGVWHLHVDGGGTTPSRMASRVPAVEDVQLRDVLQSSKRNSPATIISDMRHVARYGTG